MKNKLKFLIKHGLKKKFGSKSFKIVNLLLLLLIPALFNVDKIIEYFGGDFNKPTNIIVVDNAGVYENFETIYNQSTSYDMDVSEITISKSEETVDELKETMLEDKSKDVIIEIIPNEEKIFNANIYTYDYLDTFLYQNIISALNSTKTNIALIKSEIDLELIGSIYEPITVNRTLLNEELDENSEFMSMVSGFLVPVIVIPFFFLIILVVQYIGAEINEEKTSRSMEIIISSVSPKTHFISKIISTNVFILSQGLLLVFYSIIGIIVRTKITNVSFIDSFGVNVSDMVTTFMNSGMFSDILLALPLVLIIILLSFLAYSLAAGILASMTTSIEDYQQLQTPIMLLMMAGYYLGIVASVYENAVFIKFISYIPFISAFLSPVLLLIGQIGVIDALISMALLVVTCFILIKYGLKIYKVGILNYSSSKLWKKMFKAVKG